MEFWAAVEDSVGMAGAAHSFMSRVTTCGAPHTPAHQKRLLPCEEQDHHGMLPAQMPGALFRRPDLRCKAAPSHHTTDVGMPCNHNTLFDEICTMSWPVQEQPARSSHAPLRLGRAIDGAALSWHVADKVRSRIFLNFRADQPPGRR